MGNLYAQRVPCHTQAGDPSCAGHRETPLTEDGCPRCLAGDPPVREFWFKKTRGRLWHFVPKDGRDDHWYLLPACGYRPWVSGCYFDDSGDRRVDCRPEPPYCGRCLRVATREQLKGG